MGFFVDPVEYLPISTLTSSNELKRSKKKKMADLLPALSSDEENGQFDDDTDDEDEKMDIEFGGVLVSCLCRKAAKFAI